MPCLMTKLTTEDDRTMNGPRGSGVPPRCGAAVISNAAAARRTPSRRDAAPTGSLRDFHGKPQPPVFFRPERSFRPSSGYAVYRLSESLWYRQWSFMAGHNEPGSRLAGASARQMPSPAPSPIGSRTQWAQVPQVTGVAGLSVASGSRSGSENGSAVCSGSMLRASGYQVRTSSKVAGGVNECAATEPSR